MRDGKKKKRGENDETERMTETKEGRKDDTRKGRKRGREERDFGGDKREMKK